MLKNENVAAEESFESDKLSNHEDDMEEEIVEETEQNFVPASIEVEETPKKEIDKVFKDSDNFETP